MPTTTPQPEPTETKWRVIITDTETPSGVAPICPGSATLGPANPHWNDQTRYLDLMGVWDCCPGPHLQCINESDAVMLATMLNSLEVEICS